MKQNRWDWLPAFMPGVSKLLDEKRAQHGAAWVAECWKKGVMQGEPGWFFAAENRLSVGVPAEGMAEAYFEQVRPLHPGAFLLSIKEPADVA